MVIRAWRTLVDIMRIWQERSRARYQLAAMTERELLDCGMSRSEIEYELRRPVGGDRDTPVPILMPGGNLWVSAGVWSVPGQ